MNNNSSIPLFVIDDDNSILEFFRDVFSEMNLTIQTESDGRLGLKKVLQGQIKIVFLDIMLNDVNGLDILKEIKLKKPEVKVIMISGYLTEEVVEKALQLGADGYLYKPLSVRDILSRTLKYIKITGGQL